MIAEQEKQGAVEVRGGGKFEMGLAGGRGGNGSLDRGGVTQRSVAEPGVAGAMDQAAALVLHFLGQQPAGSVDGRSCNVAMHVHAAGHDNHAGDVEDTGVLAVEGGNDPASF